MSLVETKHKGAGKWYVTIFNKLQASNKIQEKDRLNSIMLSARALEYSMGLDTSHLINDKKGIQTFTSDNWCKSFLRVSNMVSNAKDQQRIPKKDLLPSKELEQFTYYQSLQKLRKNPKRPLVQLVLIQHMVLTIKDNIKEDFDSNYSLPNIPCHMTGVKDRKFKRHPSLRQIFNPQDSLSNTEDDDVPIALLAIRN